MTSPIQLPVQRQQGQTSAFYLITYFNQYASADRACLEGSAEVTLPNGTIIQETFNSQDCPGAIGDPRNGFVIGSSFTYCDLCFAWYPQITSPNGTVPYTIAFYGNRL